MQSESQRFWRAKQETMKTVSEVIPSFATTRRLLGFALEKLRGSLRPIPARDAVFSKDSCKCIRDFLSA
jgi:hypothetical protein